ncbi:MAG: hypothetical protein U1D67_04475, partial [Dehalococcoidia bacterium]|nr:hypothetical protein [Dehalococcoidia bacterium]
LLLATAEILSRYKDEPWQAVCSRWGIIYMLSNGLLSASAFGVMLLANVVNSASSDFDSFKFATYAGLGAMVFIRTKLFNLKSGTGEKISVGPDFMVDTWLNFMDRQIDRQRALERCNVVRDTMDGVDFDKVKIYIPTMLMKSMQSLSEREEEKLGSKISELESQKKLSNQEKSYTLGFMVLDLAGEKLLKNILGKDRSKYLI